MRSGKVKNQTRKLMSREALPNNWLLGLLYDGDNEFIDDWNIFVWLNRQSGRDEAGHWPVSNSLDKLNSLSDEERDAIILMLKMEKFSK
jgi:hypothetical protein